MRLFPTRVVCVAIFVTTGGGLTLFGSGLLNAQFFFVGWSVIFVGLFFGCIAGRLWIINHRIKHAMPEWLDSNITFFIVVAVCALACLVAAVASSSKNPQTIPPQQIVQSQWQPPELPKDCKWVTLSTAGGNLANPSSWPRWNVVSPDMRGGGALVLPGAPLHISARVVDNRFFVDADITFDSHQTYSISNMAFVGDMPAGWDRNCNSNAFEIIGPDNLPVFQEIYVQPEHIILNGLVPKKPGIIMGMFGHDFISGFTNEVLPNLDRKPIFKYPSWKYPGQYSD